MLSGRLFVHPGQGCWVRADTRPTSFSPSAHTAPAHPTGSRQCISSASRDSKPAAHGATLPSATHPGLSQAAGHGYRGWTPRVRGRNVFINPSGATLEGIACVLAN